MRKLDTIQKTENLNEVFAADIKEYNAHHNYKVIRDDVIVGDIAFQKGPRKNPNSTAGITESDLLEIVRDRLTDFQNSPFACKENENALSCVEMALDWLYERTLNRAERKVLGTNER